jgi:cytoskeletal protein CcmA (bactofilin family)
MRIKKGKAQDEILSILDKGLEMTGEISFTTGVRVNGVINGKVRSEAVLEIGPGGKVDAEITIRKILINGEFRGVIHASDRVEIHKNGKAYGDIYTPCLIIEAGALFEGRCNMSDAQKFRTKEPGAALQAIDSDTAQSSQLASGSPKN